MRSRLAYNDNDLIMSVCIIHTKYMNFELVIVTMGKRGDQDFSVKFLKSVIYLEFLQMNVKVSQI